MIAIEYKWGEVEQNSSSYRCLLRHHRFHMVLRWINTSEELSSDDRKCSHLPFSAIKHRFEYLKFLHFIALIYRGPEILVLHKDCVIQLCGTGEFQEEFLCSQALVAEFSKMCVWKQVDGVRSTQTHL